MALLEAYPSANIMQPHDFDDSATRQTPNKLKTDAAGGNDFVYPDYDASGLPFVSTAPDGPWRQVVEASDGNEYLLGQGFWWRDTHDGKIDMWFQETMGVLTTKDFLLPIAVSNPLEAVITSDFSYTPTSTFVNNTLVMESQKQTNITGFDGIKFTASKPTDWVPRGWPTFVSVHIKGGIRL